MTDTVKTTPMTAKRIIELAHARFSDGKGRAFKQASMAQAGEGSCMYRAPNGNKCVVGAMLPDELYHPSMEGNGVSGLLEWFKRREITPPKWMQTHKCILKALQRIHDAEDNWNGLYLNERGRALFNQLSMLIYGDDTGDWPSL